MFLLETEIPIPVAPDDAPAWLQLVFMVLGIVITVWLVPFLRARAQQARAVTEEARTTAVHEELNAKSALQQMVADFAYNAAANIAEQRFPGLIGKVQRGELTLDADSMKTELRGWGTVLREQIVDYLDQQGIDAVAALGNGYIDQLIQRVANQVSPFPGKETAVALVQDYGGQALEMLAKKGVDWVREDQAIHE